jgi:dethiobiotin synthetase
MSSIPGLFVTGTDTDVGKTYIAALIARQLRETGRRVGVYKPVASGCRRDGDRLVSDDAAQLWEAAGRPGTVEEVCPQCYESPVAPNVAARMERRPIDEPRLRHGLDVWRERSDVLIVEGAGGWFSPLGDRTLVADLAVELRLPVVVVARNTLGTINHTLLTVRAIEAVGLSVACVVLNSIGEPDASSATNLAELQSRLEVPVVALARGATKLPRELKLP